MRRHVAVIGGIVLLLAVATRSAGAQEVVFSRRVYAAQGTTYQQLWTWSVPDGMSRQLTNSPRNHGTPVCSSDGKQIFFSTSAFDRNGALVENHLAPPSRHRDRIGRDKRLHPAGDSGWQR